MENKMNHRACILVLATLLSLLGCATGKDSVLFVTKTSIAIDADTNPPTFDVGYGRYEGSIAPVVQDGQALPIMSSISSDGGISSGVFGSGVAQNFGVGNAAIIMSQYLGSSVNPAESARTGFDSIISSPATVSGTIETGKRYFFGTKTTLGFTTSFSAERGYTPDSISLGYKRKEAAFVPIRQNGSSGSETLSIPSMLATSGSSSNAAINKSGFSVSQFYATGSAANYLAAHPVIRNTVISKLIGDDTISTNLELDREANELDEAKQERIDNLLSSVDKVTDASAVNLVAAPPTSDPKITSLISARDPSNLRASNANIARQLVKMQIVYFKRDEQSLNAWESAITSMPKK